MTAPAAVRDRAPVLTGLIARRARRLTALLTAAGADAFAGVGPRAAMWLGHTARRTGVVVADGEARLLPVEDIPQVLRREGFRTVAVDDQASPGLVLRWAAELDGIALRDGRTVFRRARAVKDVLEEQAMARACGITEAAFADMETVLHAGTTELDLAQAFERAARTAGADGAAYELSVTAGRRTARPWGGVTTAPLAAGAPVQVDAGVWFRHYRADLTRSYWIGPPDGEEHRRYAALAAVAAGLRDELLAHVRAGEPVARLARLVAEGVRKHAGAARMPHVPAHGLGLEIHEEPVVSERSDLVLEPGMVLSAEPGLYTADLGVRVESLVVVTEDGWRPLPSVPPAGSAGPGRLS